MKTISALVLIGLSLTACSPHRDEWDVPRAGLVSGQGVCPSIEARVGHKHPCSVHQKVIGPTAGQN